MANETLWIGKGWSDSETVDTGEALVAQGHEQILLRGRRRDYGNQEEQTCTDRQALLLDRGLSRV